MRSIIADDYDIQEAIYMGLKVAPARQVAELSLVPVAWEHKVPQPTRQTRAYKLLRRARLEHDAVREWLADEANWQCLKLTLEAVVLAGAAVLMYVGMAAIGGQA